MWPSTSCGWVEFTANMSTLYSLWNLKIQVVQRCFLHYTCKRSAMKPQLTSPWLHLFFFDEVSLSAALFSGTFMPRWSLQYLSQKLLLMETWYLCDSQRKTQQAQENIYINITLNQAQTNADTILLLLLYEKHVYLTCYLGTFSKLRSGFLRGTRCIRWASTVVLGHAFPYLSLGKAYVMTPSRLWHSARWLKCSLTLICPGDEICRTPLLRPHGNSFEIWRLRWINWGADHLGPICDKQYAISHLSCAR